MRFVAGLLALPLLACTPLAGDWAGPLRCGDVNEDVAFSLDWSGQAYEGEGAILYQGQSNGSDVDITVGFSVAVEPTVGESGELAVTAESHDCSYREGDTDVEFDCVLELDDGNSFAWDRGDHIDVRGNCEGRITRAG